jgi:putative transcriptional regulator
LPLAGVDTDWRAFRAKLVAAEAPAAAAPPAAAEEDERWAHTIPQAETGCLLLSHPLMFVSSQTYFFHSAIFLFSHDATGSAGLVINRPTQYTVRETAGTEEQLQPEFSDCQLYLGGDVGRETIHLLHGGARRACRPTQGPALQPAQPAHRPSRA